MKKAKDFSLKDINDRNTYQLSGESKVETPISSKDTEEIFLEISDDTNYSTANLSAKVEVESSNILKDKLGINLDKYLKRGVPIKDKSTFYELISTMLSAGISIIQAVKIYSEQTTNKTFKKTTQQIVRKLETGKSFSESLQDFPHIFAESEIGIVSSGEVTGKLNEVLQRLSKEIEEGLELRGKIRSALIYPVIVICFVFLTVYAMLRFVIPQIKDLFASTGLDLPAVTKFMISASDLIINNSFLLFSVAIIFLAFVSITYSTPRTRYIYHKIFLKTPVLKDFLAYIYQARFARNISNLMNAGVSVVRSLEITANGISNLVYKQRVYLTSKDVAQGITISESLQDSPLFSGLTTNMLAIGEKTAQIDDLAMKVASYYDMKTREMADNFSKIIQPFIILFVGSLVGVVVLAVMLPMTELLSGIDSF